LDIDDAVLVLIDHQTGLFNLVRDMDVADLRNNVLALAKAGRLSGIPVVLTALDEEGPHGRLLPEFEQEIPNALFVPREGDINAWDFPDFVQTIEKTGKKTLIMAGTIANVHLAFAAISAACCGYKVYAVVDASGSTTKIARELLLHRLSDAGVTTIDTLGVICELMKTHKRKDIGEWWTVMCDVLPRYKLAIDTFCKGDSSQALGKGQLSNVGQGQSQYGQGQYGNVDEQQYGQRSSFKDRFKQDQDVKGQDVYGKGQEIGTGGYGKDTSISSQKWR
jgi:nicotinamidase-related amidase